MTQTKKYSFKGWSLREWARHNKEGLKSLILVLGGYSYFQGFEWQAFIIALIGVASKLCIDTLDYWLKEE